MDITLLEKLSNADGIASNEFEVRRVLREALQDLPDTVTYQTDGLGSLIYSKKGKSDKSLMFCAHMDEVGFMVRHIADNGMLLLMVVGGVKPLAQMFQKVRVTTFGGEKIPGFIQGTFQEGTVSQLYCDIGAKTQEEAEALGIEVGNMVTFASDFEAYATPSMYVGKAMDDRLGCLVLAELLCNVSDVALDLTVHFAFTSSEEVGIRGAKTATDLIKPDVAVIVDVATYNDDFYSGYRNQRKVGAGPILTHFDRTLAPNVTLQRFIKKTAQNAQIPLQLDMFNTGGTDGGETHKANGGTPTVVTILPCRNGHCPYSIICEKDIDQMIHLHTKVLENMTEEIVHEIRHFGLEN